jgi:hypothetical protein
VESTNVTVPNKGGGVRHRYLIPPLILRIQYK